MSDLHSYLLKFAKQRDDLGKRDRVLHFNLDCRKHVKYCAINLHAGALDMYTSRKIKHILSSLHKNLSLLIQYRMLKIETRYTHIKHRARDKLNG